VRVGRAAKGALNSPRITRSKFTAASGPSPHSVFGFIWSHHTAGSGGGAGVSPTSVAGRSRSYRHY
jgi:hypothetical protein